MIIFVNFFKKQYFQFFSSVWVKGCCCSTFTDEYLLLQFFTSRFRRRQKHIDNTRIQYQTEFPFQKTVWNGCVRCSKWIMINKVQHQRYKRAHMHWHFLVWAGGGVCISHSKRKEKKVFKKRLFGMCKTCRCILYQSAWIFQKCETQKKSERTANTVYRFMRWLYVRK